MEEETNSLIARWYMSQTNYGGITSRDFSDWAVERLENGVDSKNLRILASMFNVDSLSEIHDYFKRSLEDLDWDFPTRSDCIERYGEFLAKGILDKTIEIDTACGMMSRIYYACDYPDRFSEWGLLLDDEMSELEYETAVTKEAENFLRNGRIKYAENVEERPLFSESSKHPTFLEKLGKLFR